MKSKMTLIGVLALSAVTLIVPLAHSSCTPGELNTDQGGNLFTVAQRDVTNTDFTTAAESTINGVVSIKSFVTPRGGYGRSNRGGYDPFSDPFFEFFFGGSPRGQQQPRQQQEDSRSEKAPEQQLGLGSGVILSPDGYIVTNNHVIDGAERLEVTLNDNTTYDAEVIGSDPTTDLALIKIDATGLPVIPVGNSDDLKVGEWVLAVGNPFGFTSTVTTGIVSAKARSISSVTHNRAMGIESYIQTDAAVNPGNSGGALVNLAGQLVGINTAIYSQTGSYSGYSFAIPTSIMSKVVKDLRDYGTVQRAVLGVTISDLTPALAKEKDVTATKTGVYVATVADGSAAEAAGIKEDDIITAVNGVEVRSVAQLQEQIAKYAPGESVTVTFYRDNSKKTATVRLLDDKGTTKVRLKGSFDELGCNLSPADADVLKKLRLPAGVEVTDIKDGRFKSVGMRNGFIISDINNMRVNSADDVKKIYNAILADKDSDPVMFITGVYPSTGRKTYYAVPLED
ncbi:MAG: Do family serine endopeptidase [Muribaculaceae bacterium]|nr:Do family serine endopeptidase [Muribaculaceae bacterium]